MRIAFIGGGIMGEALVCRILALPLVKPGDIVVADPVVNRLAFLQETYDIHTTDNNSVAIENADVVILAIKPQNVMEVCLELNPKLKSNQLVISIIAGTRSDQLVQQLGHTRVIRAMPNTPAQIGQGMTVWTSNGDISSIELDFVKTLLRSLGSDLYVDDEDIIDQATAISGSGPAYLFLFLESLIDSGTAIGLPIEVATQLAVETLAGASSLAKQSPLSPTALRKAVTSPGGTTIEALNVLEDEGLRDILARAVVACFKKSVELGKK